MTATETVAAAALPVRKKHSLLYDLFRRLLKEKPVATAGLGIIVALILTAFFAPLLAPYSYDEINLGARLLPPSGKYLLGTDNLGQDLLSRIIFGARISIAVAVWGAFLDAGVAMLIGITSGFIGGKLDLIVQRFVDAFFCFPTLFIAMAVVGITGPGLTQVIFIMGILGGIHASRTVRSAVLGIKENVYVNAAQAIGAPTTKILISHILPNITAPLLIIFSLAMGRMVLQEASLSFLGFGIPPPLPSWGGMLSGDARAYMEIAPWLAVWPGVALTLVIYGINMFGDGVRDILDPRLRGGLGRYDRAHRAMQPDKLQARNKQGKNTPSH